MTIKYLDTIVPNDYDAQTRQFSNRTTSTDKSDLFVRFCLQLSKKKFVPFLMSLHFKFQSKLVPATIFSAPRQFNLNW